MFEMAKNTDNSPSDCVSQFYNPLDLESKEILPEKSSLITEASKIQTGGKSKIPKDPELLADLVVPEEWQKLDEDDGIFYDSREEEEGNRVIFYSTQSNLDMLDDCKQISGDGTFKVPKKFRQLFSIHGHVNNRFLPLAYFFMEKKNKQSYAKCFKILKKFKVCQSMCSKKMFNFQMYFQIILMYCVFSNVISN